MHTTRATISKRRWIPHRLVEQLDAHLTPCADSSTSRAEETDRTPQHAANGHPARRHRRASLKPPSAAPAATKRRRGERFFAPHTFGHGTLQNQRPELWNLFNGRKHQREHFRAFPLATGPRWTSAVHRPMSKFVPHYPHRRDVIRRTASCCSLALHRPDGREPGERRALPHHRRHDPHGAAESMPLRSTTSFAAAAARRNARADDKRPRMLWKTASRLFLARACHSGAKRGISRA